MCGFHYNHVFLSCLLYCGLKIFIFLNKRLTLCTGKITYALELQGVWCRQHLPRFLCPDSCWPINRCIQGLPRQGLPCTENVLVERKTGLQVGKFPRVQTQASNKGRPPRVSGSTQRPAALEMLPLGDSEGTARFPDLLIHCSF